MIQSATIVQSESANLITRKRDSLSMIKPATTIAQPEINLNKDNWTGYAFRGWRYAIINVSLGEDIATAPERGCLDTGAGIIIADEAFFQRQTQGRVSIRFMPSPITVHGINSNEHITDGYAVVHIQSTGITKDGPAVARLRHEVHLVRDLKTNTLIGNDVLGPEQGIIDPEKRDIYRQLPVDSLHNYRKFHDTRSFIRFTRYSARHHSLKHTSDQVFCPQQAYHYHARHRD